MDAAKGILTSHGAARPRTLAVVAAGMGKCCVAGAGEIRIDEEARRFTAGGDTVNEGDWITLDGSTGEVFLGKLELEQPEVSGDFADADGVGRQVPCSQGAHQRRYSPRRRGRP